MILLVHSPWSPPAEVYDDGISSYVAISAYGPPDNDDAAFDATVVIHELTHAALAGLNQCSVAWAYTQWQVLHEGTADFFAIALLCEPELDPGAVFASTRIRSIATMLHLITCPMDSRPMNPTMPGRYGHRRCGSAGRT
jgi:hypothetical protein